LIVLGAGVILQPRGGAFSEEPKKDKDPVRKKFHTPLKVDPAHPKNKHPKPPAQGGRDVGAGSSSGNKRGIAFKKKAEEANQPPPYGK
jgi:hypothetical protein